MKLWKVLGLAGVAGVAATGVAVARSERRRNAYEPAEVRARLHERYIEATGDEAASRPGPQPPGGRSEPGRMKAAWAGLRRRLAPRRST